MLCGNTHKLRKKNDGTINNSEKYVRNTYESVIDQIRSSGLNFQLQLSPFSAQISLKRSLVKERSGVLRCPHTLKKEPPVHDHENRRENRTLERNILVKKETEENNKV